MDILITGISKSGKTSIKKVVFEKIPPNETVYNETTENLEIFNVETLGFCKLNIIEFPSTFKYEKANDEVEKILNKCGSLIFIINSQEKKEVQYEYFKKNIVQILLKHKNISLSILIHKNDNSNISCNDFNLLKEEIKKRIIQIQKENSLKDINITFFTTSIYNTSIFEAFSKILQNIIIQNKNLSILTDEISKNCKFENAFLFDVFNKIYLGVNNSSVESSKTYDICTNLIDIVLDMVSIYGDESYNDFDNNLSCSIKLNDLDNKGNNYSENIICLKFIDFNLALVVIMDEKYYERTNLMNYNVKIFEEAVKNILNKN